MIEVWTWPTPNGHKVHIALEELGLSYKVIPVNIGTGEQFKPEFLAISPNHRIPAIVDREGPSCAIPTGAASIWPNIPRSSTGMMRSPRGRQCSAASRC
jgi:glutathione S-transferase